MMEAKWSNLTRLARSDVDIMEHAQAQDDGEEAVQILQDIAVHRDILSTPIHRDALHIARIIPLELNEKVLHILI